MCFEVFAGCVTGGPISAISQEPLHNNKSTKANGPKRSCARFGNGAPPHLQMSFRRSWAHSGRTSSVPLQYRHFYLCNCVQRCSFRDRENYPKTWEMGGCLYRKVARYQERNEPPCSTARARIHAPSRLSTYALRTRAHFVGPTEPVKSLKYFDLGQKFLHHRNPRREISKTI